MHFHCLRQNNHRFILNSKMPSLSIIIINYNTPELTERCVDSVLSFTELSDFEVIIVDNGSSKRYLPNTDSRVKYVYNRKNLGFSGGNNLGLTLAMGEYILLLNSDTIISDNCICPIGLECFCWGKCFTYKYLIASKLWVC